MLSAAVFFGVALLAFAGALTLVFHRNPVVAVLGMAVAMVGLGVLYMLLAVPFLGLFLMIVYAGAVMESGPAAAITGDPVHPYTRALLSAVAGTDPAERRLGSRIRLAEERPIPPGACPFAGRCPDVHAACVDRPPLRRVGDRQVACHLERAT